MFSKSQLLKGILEGCILALIHRKPAYGYELSVLLSRKGLGEISEGSIYPVLLRLQKEELIKGKMVPSQSGPSRKYYELTEKGGRALEAFKEEWCELEKAVTAILESEREKAQ
ncbi:PadR family transcriptional regulator [Alteribacter natronophilus]|uniref:PadR family transcriptional regulator n=1 Tax=Alteribacter natronophilus TaxID=2583810 RepID=UPI00110EE512|nr:PadR family transcriptional regulator [Alteribacter natronophilus]TMW73066.1 PadR family transcriptional regulator [Alteribacter natronophilus]